MIRLFKPDKHLQGRIRLERSKSISNRALIIRELCQEWFSVENLSGSSDTQTLEALLRQWKAQKEEGSGPITLDAGAGGTTFRFLTAFLAFQPGVQILTGNQRMKERPIGPLVEALRQLGARINYLEAQGFPPLRIEAPDWADYRPEVSISATTSSQFISALLLAAPGLPEGLLLHLEGPVVSRPYIGMTLDMMRYFGVESIFSGSEIRIPAAAYQARPFSVEADWTGASYFYAFAALSESCDLFLEGLDRESMQGDAALAIRMEAFGVKTAFEPGGARLSRVQCPPVPLVQWDFIANPDLAQTISALCAATGCYGLFLGLETLRIKETDRIAALQRELEKVGVRLGVLPHWPGASCFLQEGTAHWNGVPEIATYGDHRMAMAFSALSFLGPIRIEKPEVVEKSYPNFWNDLKTLGFEMDQGN